MKKLLFYACSFLMLFALASCDYEESQYYDIKLIQRELVADRWTLQESPNMPGYYAATFNVPSLTSYQYRTGIVNCEIILGDSRQPLPYSTHYMNEYGEMWTRTVDFQYREGEVTIFVTASDYYLEVPERMTFRFSIICQE